MFITRFPWSGVERLTNVKVRDLIRFLSLLDLYVEWNRSLSTNGSFRATTGEVLFSQNFGSMHSGIAWQMSVHNPGPLRWRYPKKICSVLRCEKLETSQAFFSSKLCHNHRLSPHADIPCEVHPVLPAWSGHVQMPVLGLNTSPSGHVIALN